MKPNTFYRGVSSKLRQSAEGGCPKRYDSIDRLPDWDSDAGRGEG